MIIQISGKQAETEDGITILQLMEQQQVETPQYVTVAVNNAFIPMDRYECYALQEGDARAPVSKPRIRCARCPMGSAW